MSMYIFAAIAIAWLALAGVAASKRDCRNLVICGFGFVTALLFTYGATK